MAEVQLAGVRKVYPGGFEAVKDFTLDIADGEFVVLVGASGCGKSTTLRMIAGLESVTGGEVSIGGRVVNDVHPKDRDIAMVFQNYALYPHMSVYKNMAFALSLRKVPKGEIDTRVREAARMLELEDLLDRKPKALSGGQRQRVAVGRAIVREPACFLFDEPLSNLDAKLRVTTRGELKALRQRLKTTTVYVTHDQEEAMTLGDRVVVMADGVIQQADSPFETYQRPANRFVAGFIGMPPMNFLDGRVEREGDRFVFVERGEDGQRLALPAEHAAVLASCEERELVLGMRPTTLGEPESDDARAHAEREGRLFRMAVEVVEPLGDQMDVHGRTAGHGGITTRVAAHSRMPIGAEAVFVFDPGEVHLFEPGEFGRNVFAGELARVEAA